MRVALLTLHDRVALHGGAGHRYGRGRRRWHRRRRGRWRGSRRGCWRRRRRGCLRGSRGGRRCGWRRGQRRGSRSRHCRGRRGGCRGRRSCHGSSAPPQAGVSSDLSRGSDAPGPRPHLASAARAVLDPLARRLLRAQGLAGIEGCRGLVNVVSRQVVIGVCSAARTADAAICRCEGLTRRSGRSRGGLVPVAGVPGRRGRRLDASRAGPDLTPSGAGAELHPNAALLFGAESLALLDRLRG
mmetsp:Transcript_114826/g.366272  ORF Transcript_114826/g.366272 Transcript_114826/m.366272 type:complete len:242 (+) Transcript_114826:1234-1959(+)